MTEEMKEFTGAAVEITKQIVIGYGSGIVVGALVNAVLPAGIGKFAKFSVTAVSYLGALALVDQLNDTYDSNIKPLVDDVVQMTQNIHAQYLKGKESI